MLEKTQGKSSGEKTPRKVKDFEAEGREERETKRWGDKESVGEQERGEEVGNVTGASGWQGWAGWGRTGEAASDLWS